MAVLVKLLINIISGHARTYEEMLAQSCSQFVGHKVIVDQIEEQDHQ